VWYPATLCDGTRITAVRCIADSAKPECAKVELDREYSGNFDCREGNGADWICADRKMRAECSYSSEGVEKDFAADTTRAFCIKAPEIEDDNEND
jgi:hypothetical protein